MPRVAPLFRSRDAAFLFFFLFFLVIIIWPMSLAFELWVCAVGSIAQLCIRRERRRGGRYGDDDDDDEGVTSDEECNVLVVGVMGACCIIYPTVCVCMSISGLMDGLVGRAVATFRLCGGERNDWSGQSVSQVGG